MGEYRVTFGTRYRYEQHPLSAALGVELHPDGWVAIDADCEPAARAQAFARLGRAWAFLYAAPFESDWGQLYPRGELVRLSAQREELSR